MKPFIQHVHPWKAALMSFILCGTMVFGAGSEDTKGSVTNASASSVAATNGYSGQSIPRSVFIVPTTAKEGRDPFFPNLPPGNQVVSNPTPGKSSSAAGVNELMLQGISGQSGARLCVINTRTFAVGEENDVPTISGSIRVRCLEINETNIVIELGGARQELYFKSPK